MSKEIREYIYQGNPVIEARRKFADVQEMRIFALVLQRTNPHISPNDKFFDGEFKEIVISASELTQIYGDKNFLYHVKKASKNLVQRYIEVNHAGGWINIPVFSFIEYENGIGLRIKLNDYIKPYVLDLLGKPYTRIQFQELFHLSSTYAWRLLELLLQYHGFAQNNVITRNLSFQELRYYLDIPENSYKGRLDNFRKRTLDLPIADIEKKTSYKITYTPIKSGRKITGFCFKMFLPTTEKLEEPKLQIEQLSQKNTYENKQNISPVVQNIPSEKPIFSPDISVHMPTSYTEEIKREMIGEGMPLGGINTWFKQYGEVGVVTSWHLALDHAARRKLSGNDRRKYLKGCMEKNIGQINQNEADIKMEIDEREKRVSAEKQQAVNNLKEGFDKLGIRINSKGQKIQSMASLLSVKDEPEEKIKLTPEIEKKLVIIAQTLGINDEKFVETLEKYDVSYTDFVRKHIAELLT